MIFNCSEITNTIKNDTRWQGDALFALHVALEQFTAEFFELCQIRAEAQDRATITADDVKNLIHTTSNNQLPQEHL